NGCISALPHTSLRAELSADVCSSDLAGKGPLTQGSDYSLSYSPAPNCQLNLTMLTATATIGPTQHLIIRYQTQLDANSQSAATRSEERRVGKECRARSTTGHRKRNSG